MISKYKYNREYYIKFRQKEREKDFKKIYKTLLYSLELFDCNVLKNECLKDFCNIREKLGKFTKYRNPKKLAPIIIYLNLKSKGITITSRDIISVLNIDKKVFSEGLKLIIPLYPPYLKRNRINIVHNTIYKIESLFNLNSDFSKNSMIILSKLWHYLKHTKEEVIAGIVCVLSLIKMKIFTIDFFKICEKAGTTIGSVSNCFKNRIIRKLNIDGFYGLRKSATLIFRILKEKFQIN